MAWSLYDMIWILPYALLLWSQTSNGAVLARQEIPPTAAVKNGTYHGLRNPTYDQDFFLGMPFAQPPLDDLWFRNPVSLNTTWTGTKNATQYGYACYGYGSDDWVLGNPVSEDCLTINGVRPSGIQPQARLPIGVWS